jgi:hypothetical protein
MDKNNNLYEKPIWFGNTPISKTFDARSMLESGQHPLEEVSRQVSVLKTGQIFELITPFPPLPLIGKITTLGFEAFINRLNETELHTYFYKI